MSYRLVTLIRRKNMAESTKERILETALELFAQNGYLGTSMNDIARQLGFTKAALYKHYTSKQEILDKIVERMNKMDYERAESYEMPGRSRTALRRLICTRRFQKSAHTVWRSLIIGRRSIFLQIFGKC